MSDEGRVLQRVHGYGTLALDGRRTVRVTGHAQAVVVDWTQTDGSLAIPTGGPYLVEERDEDGTVSVLVRELYVGDLFVLGGQSNMQGSGPLSDLEVPHPLVRLFGMDRQWQAPIEPLHRLWHSPDPVHHHLWDDHARPLIDDIIAASVETDAPHLGAGLGVAFANDYVAATGVPVGLIPAAYGGSGLGDWSPTHPGGDGHCLYAGMLNITRAAGGSVAGLLWHQGEAETQTDEAVAGYVESTRVVFDAFRKDLDQPDLPVYLAQIGPFPILRELEDERRWTGVKLAQLDPDPLGAQGVVATHDLTVSDPIHLDARSQRRLGRRFARLVTGRAGTIRIAEVMQQGRLQPGPQFTDFYQVVRIRFSGLTGALSSDGRPSGFSVHTPDGALVPCVWRVEIDGDTATVWLGGAPIEGGKLYYAWGSGATVRGTLTDAVDTAVPCFGPIPLET